MILSNLIKQQSFLLKKSANLPYLQSFNKTAQQTYDIKKYFSTNQSQNQDQILQQNQTPQTTPQLHWVEKNLPEKYLPYVRLGRYEKPIGYKLLFWPCVWGAALGQSILNPLALAHLFGTFYFGSAVMRAAGCIVNDMWDRDFDNKVERTKVRPLASGELTMKQASIFLFLHLCGGLLTLTQLNWFSIALSFGIVPIAALYPLFKRFTYYPQVVLGSCFNWGVMVGYAAAADMINYNVAVPAYIGGVLWTLIYDTIYAHQDKMDDIKVGVKSTALAWGENTKNVMYGLWGTQLSLFLYAGIQGGLGLPFFPCCFASHLYLFRLIQDFNMDDPKTCWNFFVFNKNFGMLMFLSILIGKIFPKAIEEEDEEDLAEDERYTQQNKNKIQSPKP